MKIKLIFILLLPVLVSFSCDFGESEGKKITRNEIGTSGGYGYEFWMEGSVKGNMTLGSGGAFSCEWTSTPPGPGGKTGNILFRRGQKWNASSQSHQQIGNIKLDYSATYTITSGNVSYLCVYGWTRNPLVEYYILESYGSYNPGASNPNATNKGTATIDGHTYTIYQSTRTNQPSIDGTRTFEQYWSIRQPTSKRTSGTISVSEHFKAWENLGMKLGGLYEVALTIEGFGSSGMADITENVLTITK